MPDDPQPLSAGERDVIQDVLAVGGSPQAQALRRYEATLQMLDVEVADIIRTQRAQIAALEAERDQARAGQAHWQSEYEDCLRVLLDHARRADEAEAQATRLAALETAARAWADAVTADPMELPEAEMVAVWSAVATLTPAAGTP